MDRDIWDDEWMDEITGPTRQEPSEAAERRAEMRSKWLDQYEGREAPAEKEA